MKTIRKIDSKHIKIMLAGLLVVLFGGYAYLQSDDLIKGPEIVITNPESGSSLDESLVKVEGTAHRISRLYLNGQQIFTDDKGYFSESLLLAPGYNILVITATDSFNRQTEKQIELNLKS